MKNKLLLKGTIVLLGLNLSCYSSLMSERVFAEENIENTEAPTLPTREEAIENVIKYNIQDRFPQALREMGVSEDTISRISAEHFFEAAVTYEMTHIPGGNPASLTQHFVALYPEYFRERAPLDETTSAPAPAPYTREEAIDYVNKYNFQDNFPSALRIMGISEEIISSIPSEVFFEAAVSYKMTHFPDGDYGTVYHYFVENYPHYFNSESAKKNESKPIDLISEDKKEKAKENQEKIHEHLKIEVNQVPGQTLLDQRNKFKALDVGQKFNLETGEITIKHLFLLEPGEAGNKSDEDQLLGIQFEFLPKEISLVDEAESEWYTNFVLSQSINGSQEDLNPGEYSLEDESAGPQESESSASKLESVSDDETKRVFTVYYSVSKEEKGDYLLSFIDQGKPVSFLIQRDKLKSLPYQSALYSSENGYLIFDFNNIYLNLNGPTQIASSQLAVKDVNFDAMSKEAQRVSETLSKEFSWLRFESLKFKSEDKKVKVLSKDDQVIFELETEDNWDSFKDQDGNVYTKVTEFN